MVKTIKKGASKTQIREVLEKIQTRSVVGFDAYKYCGILKLKEKPLDIQKRMRDEW